MGLAEDIKRRTLLEAHAILDEQMRRRAKQEYRIFVQYVKDDYVMKWFHAHLCQKLDEFEQGKIKKMMVFMPPQHGKSELTTRRFPAYLVGKNPNRKVAVVSYNSTMTDNFNRAIQSTIDSPDYLQLFPDTKLNDSPFHIFREKDKQRNLGMLDIIGHTGSIRCIGRGGSLTGLPVDIGIIDDPIKDREEASSEDIRQKTYEWYTDVFCTRLHNDSQQLIIQTRWHEMDLAGRILDKETDWEVIRFPAIRTADLVDYDPREVGEALWEERHSAARLRDVEKKSPATYNSLYQQDPKPNTEILVYKTWIRAQEQHWPTDLGQTSWGLDFGKTTGINALLKGGMRVREPKTEVWLKEIHYASGTPPAELARLLWASGYKEGEIVWCDHVPTKIRELQLLGIAAMPAVKGPNSIIPGIDKMNEYQVYYVGDNMHMERSKYQYTVYDNIITREPVDAFNHLMDAARYCIVSKFFKEGQ
jgi:hypothetical protein